MPVAAAAATAAAMAAATAPAMAAATAPAMATAKFSFLEIDKIYYKLKLVVRGHQLSELLE